MFISRANWAPELFFMDKSCTKISQLLFQNIYHNTQIVQHFRGSTKVILSRLYLPSLLPFFGTVDIFRQEGMSDLCSMSWVQPGRFWQGLGPQTTSHSSGLPRSLGGRGFLYSAACPGYNQVDSVKLLDLRPRVTLLSTAEVVHLEWPSAPSPSRSASSLAHDLTRFADSVSINHLISSLSLENTKIHFDCCEDLAEKVHLAQSIWIQ